LAEGILAAHITIPEHVVRHDFDEESIVLNLQTGLYHGLNPTAAAMLDAMADGTPVSDAVDRLAQAFEQPRERICADVVALVDTLRARDLIEVHASGD
jgi:hypothetical protein